jgi:hypothetical protein
MIRGPRKTKKATKTSRNWSAGRTTERYSSLRDLAVTYEGHSDSIATRPPDISSRGMFINTARHFPEGAVLNVKFRLARTGVEVESRCEVRYCLEGVGVGVEFLDISSTAALAIEKELHPANSAARGNGRHSILQMRNSKKPATARKKRKKGARR